VSRIYRGTSIFVIIATLAFGLAVGSVAIHRQVRMAIIADCDAPSPSGQCFARRPVGGWPFAFLYDSQGESVVDELGPEDHFKPLWFLVDAAIFGALPITGVVVVRLRRRSRRSSG
jgi:hypothetical protein